MVGGDKDKIMKLFKTTATKGYSTQQVYGSEIQYVWKWRKQEIKKTKNKEKKSEERIIRNIRTFLEQEED